MFIFKSQNHWWVGLVILLILVGCVSNAAEPNPTSPPEQQVLLTISGSGSVTPLLDVVKPAFEADTPNYSLEVLPGSGTGGGVKGVLDGTLDVAAMARPAKDEEKAQNLVYVELGKSGQGVITHVDVGVTDLTSDQVKAIFLGEITNWTEVGGPDLPIVLFVRDEEDSSTQALRQTLLGETSFSTDTVQVLTSQSDMLAAVEGTPGSIGIATWSTALALGANVRAVSIDGSGPGESNYLMGSPLGIGYLAEDQAQVQPLIDWLSSETGQAALHKLDVVTSK